MLTKLIRWLYTFLFILCIPAIVFRLFWRSFEYPAYRQRLLERFGINLKAGEFDSVPIWVHAVSVGETLAAVALIKALSVHHAILFTCTTPTGSACFQKALETELKNAQHKILHVYMPYDIPWCLKCFIHAYKPKLLVLLETELWPNCLTQCEVHQIPVIIANARLSSRSFNRYLKISALLQPLWAPIKGVLTQSALDSERFMALGFSKSSVQDLGNLKFDGASPKIDQLLLDRMQQGWGGSGGVSEILKPQKIWLAASTHEGEETIILKVFKKLLAQYPTFKLVMVPRHPDRFDKVASMIQDSGCTFVRRQQAMPQIDTQVLLGDSLGEMWTYIALSSWVFVGGSLVPVGGHNLLEPAALAKPVITGSYLHNFLAIADLLKIEDALVMVEDEVTLLNALEKLFQAESWANQLGKKAQDAVLKNKGSIQKHVQFIESQLNHG